MSNPQVVGHPYQVVARSIARQIDSGTLKPGSKLPSVRTLAKDQGVSSMTAQKALTQLAEDGYAEAVAGLGYFVKEPPTETHERSDSDAIHEQLDELYAAVAEISGRLARLEDRLPDPQDVEDDR